jgi:hypothetical protein
MVRGTSAGHTVKSQSITVVCAGAVVLASQIRLFSPSALNW